MTYLSTLLAAPSNEASARSRPRGKSAVWGRLVERLRRWSLRHGTLDELNRLSDAQLRDIGIERPDLDNAVDRRLDELQRY